MDSPDRLETLLFQALTTLQQVAGGRGDWVAGGGGRGQAGAAVRLAPRPVFLAGREELLAALDARLGPRHGAGPGVVLDRAGTAGAAEEAAASVRTISRIS